MEQADGALLERFLVGHDEAAFERLVRRHSSMVFGVCRRILGNVHDAEDAFQAVFIVLARSAKRLQKVQSVAGWLHGIALRVALSARRSAARARERERRANQMASTNVEQERAWEDIQGVLDEELSRLPDRLRSPIILCCLENKSVQQAAQELGWSDGELRGRLAKGKEILRERLWRRGISLGAAALFALLSERASAAAAPDTCIASAVAAASLVAAGKALPQNLVSAKALSLAAEVTRALIFARIELAAAAIAVCAAILSAASLTWRQAADVSAVVAPQLPPTVDMGRVAQPETRYEPMPLPPQDQNPQVAIEVLKKLYPAAVVTAVKEELEDGVPVLEIELQVDGKRCEIEITREGIVRKVEEEIPQDALPRPVADALADLHPQAVIRTAIRKSQAELVTYEVELDVGGRRLEVAFTPAGAVVEQKGGGESRPAAGTVVPVQQSDVF